MFIREAAAAAVADKMIQVSRLMCRTGSILTHFKGQHWGKRIACTCVLWHTNGMECIRMGL